MSTILIKKNDTSGHIPASGDLTNDSGGAEIAVNTADGKLYTKNSAGEIVELIKQKMKKVLFFSSTTTWVVPSGVDYCIAEVCGGGGGGAGIGAAATAGANSAVSCGDGTFSGVGGDPVLINYMGDGGTCRSGREFSGQSAFFACYRGAGSFAGMIPAAVNKFGIELTPGETVTITVGAGGVQGALYPTLPGPGTANGGSGFINIEYYI